MARKVYFILTVVASAAAVIGLLSFVGGIRSVNFGAFLFPLLIALWAFYRYWTTGKDN